MHSDVLDARRPGVPGAAPPGAPSGVPAAGPAREARPAGAALRRLPPLGGAPLRWALAGLAALACLTMLSWPLGYDQGVFMSVGDTVARGGRPYVDAWDVKGPLVFYLTAGLQLVFGRHAWAIRAADVAVALVTAWMLWRRLRDLTSPGAAAAAAAAWPVFVAALTYDASAQYEGWIGSAVLGVTLLAARRGGYRARDLVAAGALVGLAATVKPIFPAFLAVPGVVVLMRRGARPAAARDLLLLAAGCAAPVAAVAAALWAQGALGAAWETYILYNVRVYAPAARSALYAGSSPLASRVFGALAYVSQAKVALLAAPALAGLVVVWRRDRALGAALGAWLLVGVGLVLLQGKFWAYHWAVVYPGAALLVAVAVHALAREARASGRRELLVAGAAPVALAAALWGYTLLLDVRLLLAYAAGRASEAAYYGHFTRDGEINPADERAAGAYLRARTPEGAPFANWTLHAGLAFTAGRPNVFRIHNKRELTKTRQHPITQQFRREYVERVRALRPAYVAVDTLGDSAAVLRSADDALAREFPELAAIVAAEYRPEARFGEITLYRRVGANSATGAARRAGAGGAGPPPR